MVRAIVSVLSRGFACRMLPHDIPPRQTVYPSVRRQRQDGIWTWRTDVLRTEMRRASGREAEQRAASGMETEIHFGRRVRGATPGVFTLVHQVQPP